MSASITFDDALEQARHLNFPDRIRLAQAIWNDVACAADPVTLPQELCDELDRRIARHEQHPEEASPWADVRGRIEGRS